MKGIKREVWILWFLLVSVTLWIVIGFIYITSEANALPTTTHDDPQY